MKLLPNSKQTGFSMIESLIALVIMSFGLIALVTFQVNLVGYGGLVKAKSVAVVMAQEKIEELRNMIIETDYSGIADTDTGVTACSELGYEAEAPVVRVNTSFVRCFKVTTTTEDLSDLDNVVNAHKTISAIVSWTDRANTPQSIQLNSVIAWSDPHDSAYLAANDELTNDGVSTPAGGAFVGGDNDYSGGLPEGTSDPGNGDNVVLYTTPEGTTEVIDSTTGEVLLTVLDGFSLSTISGSVYVTGTGEPEEDILNATFVVTSDAGACTRVTPTPNNVGSSYNFYNYTCYVGSSWFGNVGIIRTGNTQNSDRVCLGDPDEGSNVLSTVRVYRGSEPHADVISPINASGYIEDDAGNIIYFPVGIGGGVFLSGHDFLVTTITGQAADSDCGSPRMTSAVFAGNENDFVCLTESCPDYQTTIDISGTYTAGTLYGAQVTNGGDCLLNYNEAGDSQYVCSITFSTGKSWSGSITVQPAEGYEICSGTPTPVLLTPEPLRYSMSFTGLYGSSTDNSIVLAETDTCAGGGGGDTERVVGRVYFADGFEPNGTNRVDSILSSGSLTVLPVDYCVYQYTNGDSIGTYTCDVPEGYTGTISLQNLANPYVTDDLDYSANPVNDDLTDQNFVIRN